VSARFRVEPWAKTCASAKKIVQRFNDAGDEEARAMSDAPTFMAHLTIASVVISLNEAMLVASGIVAWGVVARGMVDRTGCTRPRTHLGRLIAMALRVMQHRMAPELRNKSGDAAWKAACEWADKHVYPWRSGYEDEHLLTFIESYETRAWEEILGIGPGPG
jgi:hypothetical protein